MARHDLKWWLSNLPLSYISILPKNPQFTVYTDASDLAWGGCLGSQNRGQWHTSENTAHINEKELYAVLYTSKSLCKDKKMSLSRSCQTTAPQSTISITWVDGKTVVMLSLALFGNGLLTRIYGLQQHISQAN